MSTYKKIIPDILSSKKWFIDKYCAGLNQPWKDSLEHLILVSDYACKHLPLILDELSRDEGIRLLAREDYFSLINQLDLEQVPALFSSALRHYRHTHFLRLLLLEYAGLITTEQVLNSWSDCADALILHALKYAQKKLAARYGLPRDEAGHEVFLYTLAMGKLGGRELNYSSDIDLIFAFSSSGNTDGAEPISNQEYFSKVAQQFMQLLQNITADGFVFRVDLRLRPNGDSGALVSSLAALETYYQEQGRDWERYAMVKARVIHEHLETPCAWFDALITPFVYRRYVDFSVIESLRSMKAMIEREVQLNPRGDDIKRGQGGIREVEFIIQSVQLVRGGRLVTLRATHALSALAALKKEGLLSRSDALKQAYLYLRRLENVLQSLSDQQTHALPTDEAKKIQVQWAMGHESWEALEAKLHQYQRIISQSFRTILGTVTDYEDEQRLLAHQLSSVWHGHVETTMAINLLTSLGFANAAHCYQMLHAFRHGSRCRRLSQAARLRLDRFMVMLLTQLIHCDKTDTVLLHVMQLLENIVGRSAYLALLTENPQAFKELLFCFSHSPYMTDLLVEHPFLLEVLLDQHEGWRPQTRAELEQQLAEQSASLDDMEAREALLRQFKLTHRLMAARAELYGLCSAVRIGTYLADIAEVVVRKVFLLASEQLSRRYPEIDALKSRFAIVAYGKLGSREMNYSSDVDLVFLYTAPPEEEGLITRLTQKIVHMLTTRLQEGILFNVDTRLRPSGSAGLLVSHLDAFIKYQQTQAWTWEHQALVKARVICGSVVLKKQFMQLKKSILCTPRVKETLRDEVLQMRAKLEQHRERDPAKYHPGGLLDLEFLVQFLVLDAQNADLARFTHPLRQLKQLVQLHKISEEDYQILKHAYQLYHGLLHQKMIRAVTDVDEALYAQVEVICHTLYG